MGAVVIVGLTLFAATAAARPPAEPDQTPVAPSLASHASTSVEQGGSLPAAGTQARLLVKFSVSASARDRSAAIAAVGSRQIGAIGDLGVKILSVPTSAAANALSRLRSSGLTKFAEEDGPIHIAQAPNDPLWASEGSEVRVNAPQAWDYTTGAANVVIAVLDTGVDSTTPDLAGSFVPGWDFVNNDSDPSDDHGHGTMVAGVAAARSNNGLGIASYCWACSIMPVKVMGSNGTGLQSTLASGITWAADHGAKVISMSVYGGAYSTLASAVQYAEGKGAVLVAAAGNSGSSAPTYPAAYPGVIGVAGTNPDDTLNTSSNYGSWVAVAAPWCNYGTSMRQSDGSYRYASFCGTSSATPATAGVLGLLASYAPSATASELAQALESTAVKESFVASGRIDAMAALQALGAGASTTASTPANTSLPTISGTAEAGQTLTATAGTWSGSPTTYAYQWRDCDSSGSNCNAIAGANASGYTAQSSDVGLTLRVTVTAANSAGSAAATSAATGVVAPAPSPTPSTTIQVTTFSASLNPQNPSRVFSVSVGSGVTDAKLTFSKCSALALGLSTGASKTGPSAVVLDAALTGGTYTYTVSGGTCSFTLTVTAPAP